ncbi:hypothetical protein OCOL_000002 [Ordospora colligata]
MVEVLQNNNKITNNSLAEILGSFKIINIDLIGPYIEKKNYFDDKSIADILGYISVQRAAEILGYFDDERLAGILGCMDVEVAAEILGFMKDKRVKKILGGMSVQRAAEILGSFDDKRVKKILGCMSGDFRNSIERCMGDIIFAKKLNEIGVSNIDEIKKMLKDSERKITAILFKYLSDNLAKVLVNSCMTSEDMRLLIKELIENDEYKAMHNLLSAIGINTSKYESHTSNDNNSKKQEKQNVYVVQVMKVLAVMIQTMIGMEDKRIDWENVIFQKLVTYTINHIFMKEETKKLIINIDLIYNTVCNGNNQKSEARDKKRRNDGSENSLTNCNWIEKIAFDILFNLLNNGEEFIHPKCEHIVKQIIKKLKPSANNYEVSQAKEQTGIDGDDKTIVEIDIPDNVPIKVKPIWIMILNYLQGEEKKPLMILFTVLFLACLSVNKQFIDETQQPANDVAINEMTYM